MSEKKLELQLRRGLARAGANVVKLHGHPMQTAGLPDLLVSSLHKLFLVEVKLDNAVPTMLQRQQLRQMQPAVVVQLHEEGRRSRILRVVECDELQLIDSVDGDDAEWSATAARLIARA